MLADKADRYNHQLFDALLPELFQGFFGVGLQPLHRAHTALVGQGPGFSRPRVFMINSAQLSISFCRVTGFFHIALGYPMGTEEHMALLGSTQASISRAINWAMACR